MTTARAITGFHLDDVGDWVAELACGHNQHVRHQPPFQERPWVLSEERRRGRLGLPLECPLCDRNEMPEGLRFVRDTPEWTHDTLPEGLRRSHRVADDTWGEVHLLEGTVTFVFESEPARTLTLDPNDPPLAIPPGVLHHVEPSSSARLYLSFYGVARSIAP